MSAREERVEACALAPTAQIRDALRILETCEGKIALVVEPRRRLLGTITDGDVRRAMLQGVALDVPVTEIMNAKPATASVGTPPSALREAMTQGGFRQMPLLNQDGAVTELLLRSDLVRPDVRPESVLLMAGGRGSRLAPLTEDAPKPMLAVGDKPILETILENFAEQGFRRFYLSVHYRSEDIKRHFGEGARFGVSIDYLEEDEPLGTAGALALLPSPPAETLIVMNGDILTKVDFDDLLTFHRSTGAAATMCVREYDFRVPYGVVEVEDYRLAAITEKPVHRFFVNAGIYVLEPGALAAVPGSGRLDMTDLFAALRCGRQEVCVFPIREYWVDIGQTDDLRRARDDFDAVFTGARP